MRKLIEKEIVLASNNPGKITELKSMLDPYGISVIPAHELGIEDVEETEETFLGNAKLKALHTAAKSGKPALADDSGLCVHELGNRPGVYTARFAPNAREGFKKINLELGKNPNRSAHFTCCLVIAWPDGSFESFEGNSYGTLAPEPRGDKGFAYDIAFIPEGYDHTFAEIEPEEKAVLSHRGKALRAFAENILPKQENNSFG